MATGRPGLVVSVYSLKPEAFRDSCGQRRGAVALRLRVGIVGS